MSRNVKTGVKRGKVARGHFSVRDSKDDFSSTRLVVRVLKGTHLLASDIMAVPPSSDPICFGWVGYPEYTHTEYSDPRREKEWGGDEITAQSKESNEKEGESADGIFKCTKVVGGTLNPKFDEEMHFDLGYV